MTKLLRSRRGIHRSDGKSVRSMVRRAALLALTISVAFGELSGQGSPSAHGFVVNAGPPYPIGRVFYTVDPSFTAAGFLVSSLYAAEQAWKINGLVQNGEFYNLDNQLGSANRRITAGFIDGPWGTDANATLPCTDNTSTCEMRFEPGSGQWNTTTERRDETWIDFFGAATHEFGHFLGLDHSNDLISSDGGSNDPTMQAFRNPSGGKHLRSIQADDENGLRAARPTSPGNLVANSSFEYQPADDLGPTWGGWNSRGWGWLHASWQAQATIYGPPNVAAEGSYYIEFNNNNGSTASSSFYQDIYVSGDPAGQDITPRVWLRDPGNLGMTASFVVWNITNAPATQVAVRNNIDPPATWQEYSLKRFHVNNGNRYRIQIYNFHSNHNLDVDFARLNFS